MFYQAILFIFAALWWPINVITDERSPERALVQSLMAIVDACKALFATAWILRFVCVFFNLQKINFFRKIRSIEEKEKENSNKEQNSVSEFALEIPLNDFINTEVGYFAMKRFLVSEFSPEGILFLTESYFLKEKMKQKCSIITEVSRLSDTKIDMYVHVVATFHSGYSNNVFYKTF